MTALTSEVDPRIPLAVERTFLAWIRTSLAMTGFGFVVARFGLFLRELTPAQPTVPIRSFGFSLWIGTGLVVLGVAVNLIASMRYRKQLRLLCGPHLPEYALPTMGITIAMILAAIGTIMAAYLLFLDT